MISLQMDIDIQISHDKKMIGCLVDNCRKPNEIVCNYGTAKNIYGLYHDIANVCIRQGKMKDAENCMKMMDYIKEKSDYLLAKYKEKTGQDMFQEGQTYEYNGLFD